MKPLSEGQQHRLSRFSLSVSTGFSIQKSHFKASCTARPSSAWDIAPKELLAFKPFAPGTKDIFGNPNASLRTIRSAVRIVLDIFRPARRDIFTGEGQRGENEEQVGRYHVRVLS